MVLDGKKIAERIFNELKALPAPAKTLAAVLVGDDPASVSFVQQKQKAAARLGAKFAVRRHPAAMTTEALAQEVKKLSADPTVGGIIVQLPLPTAIDRDRVLASLVPEKDVDALRGPHNGVWPPTVGVLIAILEEIHFDLRPSRAVVVGPGFLVGRPIADYLHGKVKALSVFDKGVDRATLDGALKNADVVISGVGAPGLIRGEALKKGVVAIDFGYAKGAAGLSGDFDFASVAPVARWITPTPGGTGPILVAELFRNFYTLST